MRLRVVAAVLVGLGGVARGDIVELKDGRRFEGLITGSSAHEVTIDTVVSNIRSKMTFRRVEIRVIEVGALPDGFFGGKPRTVATPGGEPAGGPKPEAPAAPAPTAPSEKPGEKPTEKPVVGPGESPGANPGEVPVRAAAGSYIEAPLVGTFGEDIYPKGVAAVLEEAESRGVGHVLLRLRSGGGEVWAAQQIAKVITDHALRVKTHVLVEQAMSASIWVVFAADSVLIAPGGTIGAAVVYTKDATTGAAEVDAKMNSALAAELGSIAEQRGRDPAIVRAMIMPEAELYTWQEDGPGAEDVVKVSGQKPQGNPRGLRTLSNSRDVLTLTAEEAGAIGLAERMATAQSFEVGVLERIDGWTPIAGLGEEVMRRESKVSAEARAELERLADRLQRAVVEAVSFDPGRFSYTYIARTGQFSPDSKRRWGELSDKAIGAWTQAKAALNAFEKLRGRAGELGLEGFISSKLNATELKYTLQDIDQKVSRLRKDRGRSTLPAEFERKK